MSKSMFHQHIPLLARVFGKKVHWVQRSKCGKVLNIQFARKYRGISYIYDTIELDNECDGDKNES